MIDNHVSAIVGRFPAKWIPGNLACLHGEGWFLLEVSPLPPRDEITKIVADIEHDRPIRVKNGQVRHLTDCYEDHVSSANFDRGVLGQLRNQKFRLAVHPRIENWYKGQPLAIAFDPVINYEVFPDHPHLNAGGRHPEYPGMFVPDTLCYEEDIASISDEPDKRFLETFAYLSVWLLRHMIWFETRKRNHGEGYWIGPEAASLTKQQRAEVRNPTNPCRCGSGRKYVDCHMLSDQGVFLLFRTGAVRDLDTVKREAVVRYLKRRADHDRFYTELQDSLRRVVV